MTDLNFNENEAIALAAEAAASADALMKEVGIEEATGGTAPSESPAPAETRPIQATAPLRATTLRPGLLVLMRTAINGNVTQLKEIIEAEVVTANGSKRSKVEITRTIADPEEYENAVKVRSKMRNVVATVCSQSQFGLLCPQSKEERLNAAITDAEAMADEFNQNAKCTTISVAVPVGRFADSDVQAMKAINAEVDELMQKMTLGLQNLDAKAVRDAADKARSIGAMLSDDASKRLKDAIEIARKSAREMVKASEQGAVEIDLLSIRKLTEARTQFLDLGEATEVAAPVHEGRALDLAPIEADDQPIAPTAPTSQIPQFEID